MLDDETLKTLVAKFFALVRDGGEYHEKQLWEYVSLKTRRHLIKPEKARINTLADEAGAKPEKKRPGLFLLKKPARPAGYGPNRRQDKKTIDMFGGK